MKPYHSLQVCDAWQRLLGSKKDNISKIISGGRDSKSDMLRLSQNDLSITVVIISLTLLIFDEITNKSFVNGAGIELTF